jgi:hypothetical protein
MAEDSPKFGEGNQAVQADVPQQDAQSHDVFVSYASQDTSIANALVTALELAGLSCWIAPRDVTPGALYADGIIRAINEAKALVLVLSARSIGSKHVGKEVERASSKGRPIITLRTDTAPLTPALEYFLSESQWIEVGSGGADATFGKVIESVRRHFDPSAAIEPRAQPDPPTAAPMAKVRAGRGAHDIGYQGSDRYVATTFWRHYRWRVDRVGGVGASGRGDGLEPSRRCHQ